MLPLQSSLWPRHDGSSESVGSRKPIQMSHVLCRGTLHDQDARRQDMSATETFSTLRQFWLRHYDAMEVLIIRVWRRRSTPVPIQGEVACGDQFGNAVQNSVVERHGALFKMAFEKACSLEAPTTEAEVNELIDFTFAELNRRGGRAGFSPGQRVFGRQIRLPSSLLEDKFFTPSWSLRTPLTRCGEAWLCEWQPPMDA